MRYVFRTELSEIEYFARSLVKSSKRLADTVMWPNCSYDAKTEVVRDLERLLVSRKGAKDARRMIRAYRYWLAFRRALWARVTSEGLVPTCWSGYDPKFPFSYGNYLGWVELEFQRLPEKVQDDIAWVGRVIMEAEKLLIG